MTVILDPGNQTESYNATPGRAWRTSAGLWRTDKLAGDATIAARDATIAAHLATIATRDATIVTLNNTITNVTPPPLHQAYGRFTNIQTPGGGIITLSTFNVTSGGAAHFTQSTNTINLVKAGFYAATCVVRSLGGTDSLRIEYSTNGGGAWNAVPTGITSELVDGTAQVDSAAAGNTNGREQGAFMYPVSLAAGNLIRFTFNGSVIRDWAGTTDAGAWSVIFVPTTSFPQ